MDLRSATQRLALIVAALAIAASPARAAFVQNYGNFSALTVDYKNVTESTTTDNSALFGSPGISGNALVFSPPAFGANSVNGSPAVDLTDGTLNAKIIAKPGFGIEKIVVNEAGDYTLSAFLAGSGTVKVSAPVFVTVEAVNGVDLLSPILLTTNLTFTNGGSWSLPADAASGKIWTGTGSIDVDAELAIRGISGKATRVQYTMDNQLLAFSSGPGIVAFIQKKQVGGVSITAIVPEPSTFLLAGMAMIGGLALARRKR